MTLLLNSKHFPLDSTSKSEALSSALEEILKNDYHGSFFTMLGAYQRILADNSQRDHWPETNNKLATLFKCGKTESINGPMIGIPISIRDSDCFRETAKLTGNNRSLIANIEWMATAWNASFADTGLWMGKTFEPVSRETVAEKTANNTQMMRAYDDQSTRLGRNFFRPSPNPDSLQAIALPTLTALWKLQDRPLTPDADGFDSLLLAENLQKEKAIPYSKTGAYFLCNHGLSVLPEMNGKRVYQLNYRWPALAPTYPMTRLIDELVRIDDGIYLGQLIYATRHYSLGSFAMPDGHMHSIGPTYPHHFLLDNIERILDVDLPGNENHYGYQNNGYFLMVDPAYAKEFYADDAFPQLRPGAGETGFQELAYDKTETEKRSDLANLDIDNWKSDLTLHLSFHSSVDPTEQHYRLFAYFLLLDNQWQQHRLDIGLDILH